MAIFPESLDPPPWGFGKFLSYPHPPGFLTASRYVVIWWVVLLKKGWEYLLHRMQNKPGILGHQGSLRLMLLVCQ